MSNVICDNCWDLGLCSKCQEALEARQNKVRDLCVSGLGSDDAYHKQWFLEEILRTIGIDFSKLAKWAKTEDIHLGERGIPP